MSANHSKISGSDSIGDDPSGHNGVTETRESQRLRTTRATRPNSQASSRTSPLPQLTSPMAIRTPTPTRQATAASQEQPIPAPILIRDSSVSTPLFSNELPIPSIEMTRPAECSFSFQFRLAVRVLLAHGWSRIVLFVTSLGIFAICLIFVVHRLMSVSRYLNV
eukprot:c10126_g2_i2.p1 GENE.c10126_g2_i2~~c10126_g2_i2.p1  ORF type:complete len:164 (-),score=41.08 c10126_g2_i2:25-516(-)